MIPDMPTETGSSIVVLFGAACALLVIATIAGEILRYRLARHGTHPTVETYVTRLHSWWAMVFLLAIALSS